MIASSANIQRPNGILTLLEFPRATHELAALAPSHLWLKSLPGGQGQPVIVIPGFSANNATTMILRYYLRLWGYAAKPWPLGTNVNIMEIQGFDDIAAFKDNAVTVMKQRLQQHFDRTGEKTTLIGWSLGGVFARVIAAEAQPYTQQVITLGSPFGDPRSVIVYPVLERIKKQSMSEQHLQAWMAMCNAPLGNVGITNLYSRSDGFVPSATARNINHSLQQAIHVHSSHVGFAINPLVLHLIAKLLHHNAKHWSPLAAHHAFERWLYALH